MGLSTREDLPKSFRQQTRAVWEARAMHQAPPDDFMADVRKVFAHMGRGLDWEVSTDDDLFIIDVVVDRERMVRLLALQISILSHPKSRIQMVYYD